MSLIVVFPAMPDMQHVRSDARSSSRYLMPELAGEFLVVKMPLALIDSSDLLDEIGAEVRMSGFMVLWVDTLRRDVWSAMIRGQPSLCPLTWKTDNDEWKSRSLT